jgi:hypothetical protein
LVLPGLLRLGDALTLPFTDHGSLEFSNATHHGQHQLGHGRIVAGEREMLLHELDHDAAPVQRLDYMEQIGDISRETIHAVADKDIPVPQILQCGLQLWPVRVRAARLISVCFVEFYAVELTDGVLIDGADPDIPNPLSPAPCCCQLLPLEVSNMTPECAGFVPPEHLLSRYLFSLSMINGDVAKRVAEIAARKLGASRVLDPILETGAASQSEPILGSLLTWALDEQRSGKKRFRDLQRILEQAINGRHNEIASVALDGMELLAREDICTDEFLLLLENDANYHPAWSKSDAAWSAMALYERGGRLVEARTILQQEFHHTLADRPHGFLEQTADILDKTRRLGADKDELAAMERRLSEVQTQVPDMLISESLHDVPVRITVIGGDERQARYDKAIVEGVRARFGAVELEFRHTGWSGRWGPEFDAMRATLDRSDAVVVLRLIRTNLGCRVREYSKRWIGCAGHSKSSIEAAIRVGVDLVRRDKRCEGTRGQ